MESVIIYTKNTWMGEKNLNNMKLANGSWNGNKHPIKLCSKSKAQTELANKPLLAKLEWGLVAWNKKTFRHTLSPLAPSAVCILRFAPKINQIIQF